MLSRQLVNSTKSFVRQASTQAARKPVSSLAPSLLAGAALVATAGACYNLQIKDTNFKEFLALSSRIAACDAAGGTETATGIAFPGLVDGLVYVGSGVRVKYGFVKVRMTFFNWCQPM